MLLPRCGRTTKVNMLGRLFFLFVAVPLIELTLLLSIAGKTNWRFTLALVLVTGFVGAWLARMQGWQTYLRIQRELAGGRMPTDSLVDAVMIFVAGALLLTPGILTDLFGISLLLPPCRRFYRHRLQHWFRSSVKVHAAKSGQSQAHDQIIDSYVVQREDEQR